MNSIYSSNQEVTTFIGKAQNKIADLATLLVQRANDISPLDILTLELMDFIEALDNPLTSWALDDVIRWIHEYQYRANLGEIAYLNIYGYNTTLITSLSGGNTTTSVSQLTDFEVEVNKLLAKYPHNSLSQIQGGTTDERYHLTKAMYDYIDGKLNPVSSASVSLSLSTTSFKYPSGYYELGTSIPAVNLVGAINYGTTKKAIYFEYLKNGVVLGSRNSNPSSNLQPNPVSDTTGINSDTNYSFNANFADGLKSDIKSILFRQPMYYGVIKRRAGEYNVVTDIQAKGIKDVRDKGEMNLAFNIPVGNTSLEYIDSQTPFLFIPAAWGKFTSAINTGFDFAADWSAFGYSMILADGKPMDALLIIYNTQIEGQTTFKFNW